MKIHEHKNTDGSKKNLIPTATGLLVRDGHPSNIKKCCVYCKDDHYSASCEWVNTTVGRREVLLKEGCCFLCLTSGHCANQCSSNQKCRKCNRKHHQSLCEQGLPSTGMCHNNKIKKDELYVLIKRMQETDIMHPHYGYTLEEGLYCTIHKEWLCGV